MAFKIAVVGATGNVGREMLNIVYERGFPVSEIVALASERSVGTKLPFGDKTIEVQDVNSYDFSNTNICLMSAGNALSTKISPQIAKTGCIVIDNSSAWRYHPDVPLIVPEVNPETISLASRKNIIANPNCSTIQLVVALKPLHDLAIIKRVIVSTYQSVSGAGKKGVNELISQTESVLAQKKIKNQVFTKNIAFNIIPHIDVFLDDGYTKEEWKVIVETKKILDQNIKVSCTAARVPVFIGHSESVNIEFEKDISIQSAINAINQSLGCVVVDKIEKSGYTTPIECIGRDPVFVSRIRKDPTVKSGLNLWIVANNLRKGAALNAVQIAELLV
ncbi:aspartate-semialdehyde dehydrogenase [Candidatus Liberibacter africanus]|uniref:Aspartate-semialdehyde dehydrogenase n=1 Tax=Candidatus Liberibacter africanus PTSAPSY TaxID=1277257 RepID=A0A0G3I1X5_LIBAF|nr:aspartate-semialdehyde dehydrogenase [Candidatus Liberibacter africanus]AKK19874.1 aspartate-semialdehyde dehydrogenase [Candidatus Liberibacter africanus PTSAPSY]QTP63730.1 aspartate-semialdehyde dehydrogenase [Candidatus Liberibacter africanus]